MRFLVDADLPRRSSGLLRRFGHSAVDARDVCGPQAPDAVIAAYARTEGLCLLPGDLGFADIRNYLPAAYAGIVVLRLPDGATAESILRQIESLLSRPDLIERLPGRLAIVEPGRACLRSG